MSTWNQIADDHYTALSWSGGLGRDNDGYPLEPPSEWPAVSGGIDAHIARAVRQSAYLCKFCGGAIGFVDRKPYNRADGKPHTCLADARRTQEGEKP
jgi:hypothetical protein